MLSIIGNFNLYMKVKYISIQSNYHLCFKKPSRGITSPKVTLKAFIFLTVIKSCLLLAGYLVCLCKNHMHQSV